jgi:hypothetical protein
MKVIKILRELENLVNERSWTFISINNDYEDKDEKIKVTK